MIVIGYGTGRCGTKSLAHFLNQQEGLNVTHEGIPLPCYSSLLGTDIIDTHFKEHNGDINFALIYYIQHIIKNYEDVKYINIKRDDDEVVDSFWSYQNGVRNYKVFLENRWFLYPYNGLTPSKDAIKRTISEYRFIEEDVKRQLGDKLFIMNTYDLNDNEKLNELLDWLGIGNKNFTIKHENKRRTYNSKNAYIKRPEMDVLGG